MFVQKSKLAAAAILNYHFVTLDHPRSPFAVLNLPFKFCIDRVCTFRDIAIWKFHKCGLIFLFRPPKSCFWGVLTPKFYFLLSRLLLPCTKTRILSPHWSWSVPRCDLDATRWKEKTKSKPKFAIFAFPNFRKMGEFAAFVERPKTKCFSFRELRPLVPWPGALSWTPLGALPPDLHKWLALYCARIRILLAGTASGQR